METQASSLGQSIMAVYLPLFVLIIFGKSYRVRERSGRNPIHLCRGKAGAMFRVELGLTVFVLLLLLTMLLFIFYPYTLSAGGLLFHQPEGRMSSVILALLAIALWLIVRSALDSGDSFRIGTDTEGGNPSEYRGIYRLIRMPLQLSILLTGLAQFLLLPSVATLPVVVGLALFLYLSGFYEEKWRRNNDGAAYLEYLSTTGRYLPRFIVRPRSGSTRR